VIVTISSRTTHGHLEVPQQSPIKTGLGSTGHIHGLFTKTSAVGHTVERPPTMHGLICVNRFFRGSGHFISEL
jgi:hypothetical protein